MEPQIRFCTSADGTRIAYTTMGKGPALVEVRGWMGTHRHLSNPDVHAFAESLARQRLLVSFDRRGTGASQWEVEDVSLDAEVADVVALVDHLELSQFDLFGVAESGAICVAYAAQHPDRVSRLILWSPFACGEKIFKPSAIRGLVELIRGNWSLGRRALADILVPTGPTELQRWVSSSLRESMLPDVAAKHMESFGKVDCRQYLPQVKAPTLVLHRRGDRNVPITAGREVAAAILDARFVALDGTSPWFFTEDPEAVLQAIDDFLSEGEETKPKTGLPEGMTAILFADIADSTALTERLGDAAFRAKARELDTSLRGVIRENGGTPVEGKLLGDGVLAVFTSARQAIEAALACGRAGEDTALPLHLGLHAGDVIREEDPDGRGNVYGGAVNIAARIAAASAPGEVLVSDTVRSLARTSAGVAFDDRGANELKGVSEPVRLFALREGNT